MAEHEEGGHAPWCPTRDDEHLPWCPARVNPAPAVPQTHDDALAAGRLTPDHSCPLCCQSFDFVMDGAQISYTSVREYVESRPWWWRWLHPFKRARLLGARDALAGVLDDAGK